MYQFSSLEGTVVPIFRGVQLYGFLDGTTKALKTKITIDTNDPTKQEDNPDYATWITQDQAILGGLLSSMTGEVLS